MTRVCVVTVMYNVSASLWYSTFHLISSSFVVWPYLRHTALETSRLCWPLYPQHTLTVYLHYTLTSSSTSFHCSSGVCPFFHPPFSKNSFACALKVSRSEGSDN